MGYFIAFPGCDEWRLSIFCFSLEMKFFVKYLIGVVPTYSMYEFYSMIKY